MFERIKNYIIIVRINLNFQWHERRCRLEHLQLADSKYSIKELGAKKDSLLSKIEYQANSKFNNLIEAKNTDKKEAESLINDKEFLLSYFTRNYKYEIDELYKKKDTLFQEKEKLYRQKNILMESLSEAFEKKDKAYSDLDYRKDIVNSWHAGYRKIRQNLVLYKHHRDLAYDDVVYAKSIIGDIKEDQRNLYFEIIEIKNKIGDLIVEIDKAKKDRVKMYKLTKDGYSKNKLQRDIESRYSIIDKIDIELNSLELEKNEYIISEKHKYGVAKLVSKIKKINFDKSQFISNFDSKEDKHKRKNKHKELWFKAHNMSDFI